MAVAFVLVGLGRPFDGQGIRDAAPGRYMVRELDTLPRIYTVDQLFEPDEVDGRGTAARPGGIGTGEPSRVGR